MCGVTQGAWVSRQKWPDEMAGTHGPPGNSGANHGLAYAGHMKASTSPSALREAG